MTGTMLPSERIEGRILLIRGKKVLLDRDLAVLYGVETKVLKQAVKRNLLRFPSDFMFVLSEDEVDNLRSQFVTSSWGGIRYAPMAFTEQGVAMLSSVLKSERAIMVNVQIIRTFSKLREMVANSEFFRGFWIPACPTLWPDQVAGMTGGEIASSPSVPRNDTGG